MKSISHKKTGGMDPGEFELETFLPYRLSLLTNTISQGIANSYRQSHDINITEWRVMAVLGRFPGLTAKNVAERTAMDKVAISRAVKSLEAKGFLERRADREDRRSHSLFITRGSGNEVLSEVVPQARRYEQKLLQSLDRHESDSLLQVIAKLLQTAADLNGEKFSEPISEKS